jgi:hypothetical protein
MSCATLARAELARGQPACTQRRLPSIRSSASGVSICNLKKIVSSRAFVQPGGVMARHCARRLGLCHSSQLPARTRRAQALGNPAHFGIVGDRYKVSALRRQTLSGLARCCETDLALGSGGLEHLHRWSEPGTQENTAWKSATARRNGGIPLGQMTRHTQYTPARPRRDRRIHLARRSESPGGVYKRVPNLDQHRYCPLACPILVCPDMPITNEMEDAARRIAACGCRRFRPPIVVI